MAAVGREAVAVLRAVNLQEITAREVVVGQGRDALRRDVHPSGGYLDGLRQLVGPLIVAVDDEVDKAVGWIERQRCLLAGPAGNGIAQHRLVGGIGQENPPARRGLARYHGQRPLQPQLVGLLVETPGGVAATCHHQRVGEDDVVLLVDVPHPRYPVQILDDVMAVVYLYIYSGQRRYAPMSGLSEARRGNSYPHCQHQASGAVVGGCRGFPVRRNVLHGLAKV